MTDTELLERMVEDLRRVRDTCEPKANTNPRYLRLSNAVSNINWVIDDLRAEES
jgi:hypothetical protein